MTTNFEELIIRQEAQRLTIEIYTIHKDLKDYSFRDQIQRASISIMNNIAEGYDRETDKDKRRFFVISKGSCAEVRSMLSIGNKIGYINDEQYEFLRIKCFGLSKMLYNFIQKFKDQP